MEPTGIVRFAGFADEVSVDVDRQIATIQGLGWPGIEMRLAGPGRHFDDVSEAEFEATVARLEASGIRIVAYGSQIGNWSRKISGRFDLDLAELERILPRMRRTGTKLVRIMSYPNDGWEERAWRTECLRRLRRLTRMAEDAGVVLGLENCEGWAGHRADTSLEALAEIDSRSLQLIFDTGNPVVYEQDPWAWYHAVRDHVVHVHIKDYVRDAALPAGYRAVLPGRGAGRVADIVADLKRRGYEGWFTIEPHIVSVIHEGRDATGNEAEALEVFLRYGKAFEVLYEEV